MKRTEQKTYREVPTHSPIQLDLVTQDLHCVGINIFISTFDDIVTRIFCFFDTGIEIPADP